MDTLQPKLYRISTYEYYCPTCSTHFELDHLPFFKPHHEGPNYLNEAYLKIVRGRDE